jgi:hypothetical protein
VFLELLWGIDGQVAKNKFLPNSFYNLTTRRAFGLEFVKPKKYRKEKKKAIGV